MLCVGTMIHAKMLSISSTTFDAKWAPCSVRKMCCFMVSLFFFIGYSKIFANFDWNTLLIIVLIVGWKLFRLNVLGTLGLSFTIRQNFTITFDLSLPLVIRSLIHHRLRCRFRLLVTDAGGIRAYFSFVKYCSACFTVLAR